MVHRDSGGILEPALVDDVQTLLLRLFLPAVADVPEAVS